MFLGCLCYCIRIVSTGSGKGSNRLKPKLGIEGKVRRLAREIAEKLEKENEVTVVSHIDADGIAAASIASLSLDRADIDHSVIFLKSLDHKKIEKIKDDNPQMLWFTDIGSGVLNKLNGLRAVVTDHHVPAEPSSHKESGGSVLHLNPHIYRLDGSIDISGAGTTYLVAKALSKGNSDLSSLAVIGAVGDMQDERNCRLVGTNREIVSEGVQNKVIDAFIGLRLFGRETRPLFKLLQYATDPTIPGITGDRNACVTFFLELGIDLKINEKWRTWAMLSKAERRRVVSKLVRHALEAGIPGSAIERLVGEVYVLPNEEAGELRDAKEFATLLNACGRYSEAETGLRICCGDRHHHLERARMLLRGHRETLVDSLQVIEELGVTRLSYIQYFHAGNRIPDSVIGIAAGMLMASGTIDRGLPILAFAESEEGMKVSARGTRKLVENGLDLSRIMSLAAQSAGGIGGGHDIAAGATIPRGNEEAFLGLADKLVGEQIGKCRGSARQQW